MFIRCFSLYTMKLNFKGKPSLDSSLKHYSSYFHKYHLTPFLILLSLLPPLSERTKYKAKNKFCSRLVCLWHKSGNLNDEMT